MELKGLDFKRIRLSETATLKARLFKSRTGLTPNIACRIAMAVSMKEPNKPVLEVFTGDETGQEINRWTFLGEHELSLLSMFRLWCHQNEIPSKDYFTYLMAHINRGIELLVNRVKGIEELVNLIQD